MKLISIEWRNFCSYGNKTQRIDFPQEEAALFNVCGGNGFGKSTISDVIKFSFYGRVEGRKIKDIPNRINGQAWTKVHFISTSNQNVTIERGIAPNLLNVVVDGIPYDKAGKPNIQAYIEDEILEIPFYVFTNTISLSINDFKSFLKMSPNDKRGIIDKIFGFQIINQMITMLKQHAKSIKDRLDQLTGALSAITRSIQSSLDEMELLTEKIQSSSDEKKKELEANLEKFQSLELLHASKFQEFKNEESKFKFALQELNNNITKEKSNISVIEKKIKLYDDSKCPTCASDLRTEFHQSVLQGLQEAKEQAERILQENTVTYNEKKILESDYKQKSQEFIEKGSKIKLHISNFSKEIKQISEGLKSDTQAESLQNIINKNKQDAENTKNEKYKAEEAVNWIKLLEEVLGEKGVKQMAIKTILPSLNSEILKLLIEMHLDFKVIFNEEFDATISHLGDEVSPQSLSTGEMKKVDVGVLISVIKLMKIRFPGMNFLFLDEIFSSLDPDSIHCILKILKKNTRELGLNTFVIAHNQLPTEIFDYKIEIEKNNNFSNLTLEKF